MLGIYSDLAGLRTWFLHILADKPGHAPKMVMSVSLQIKGGLL